MKENKFKNIIIKIDPDTSMDQRITEQLLNYEINLDKMNQLKWHTNTFVTNYKKLFFHASSKVAVALTVLVILGTTTAFAASYLIKSYTAEFQVIPETETITPINKKVITFGEGHKYIVGEITDSNGNVMEFDEKGEYIDENGTVILSPYGPGYKNGDISDIKNGDDVFAELGLPNLIPTYLFSNFLLEEGGYRYTEEEFDNNTILSSISAGFNSITDNKYVYIDFCPSATSTTDSYIRYVDDVYTEASFITITYITKGGLVCNIIENAQDEFNTITASIFFDSEVLGNALYMLSFSFIKMDEIKTILDSIPISIADETIINDILE